MGKIAQVLLDLVAGFVLTFIIAITVSPKSQPELPYIPTSPTNGTETEYSR